MIEPTSKDIGRWVAWKRGDSTVAKARLEGFDASFVQVRASGQLHEVPRGQLEWPEGGADKQAQAARSMFEAAGLAVESIDETVWQVERHRFWPATSMWRRPDGSVGGNGAHSLIAAVRAAAGPAPPKPGDD